MDWDLIRNNDRVVLVGTTGSGKTTLLKALVSSRPWVLLYDPKGEWEEPEWYTVREASKLPSRLRPRTRYYPHPHFLRDREDLDRFFWHAYYAENVIVVVDEAYLATLTGTWMPPGYHACIAQGRSRGIGVWTATQRPFKIPQIILSESEHFFVFRLQAPQDRVAVWAWTGLDPREVGALEKWVWYYVHEGQREGPYKLNLGGGDGTGSSD